MAVNHGPRKGLFLNQMKVKVKCSKLVRRKDINWDKLRKMQLQDLWLELNPRRTSESLVSENEIESLVSENEIIKNIILKVISILFCA